MADEKNYLDVNVTAEKFAAAVEKLVKGYAEGNTYTIDGVEYVAEEGAEIHNTYEDNYSIGINSNTFGSNNKNFADNGFINGLNNTSNGACNTIFGNNNNINNDAGRCLINGSYNTINNGVDDAFISGGYNTIDSTDDSFIFGDNNTITGGGSYEVAIGSYNKLSGSSSHKFAIGGRNTIKNSSSGQTFAIGMDNTLDEGWYSQCFGNDNTLTNCNRTNVTGCSNEVSNTDNGMFVSGYKNVVNDGQSSLISGYNNNLNQPSRSIVGGSDNTMAESTALYDACLIATKSTINGELNASALFGSFNTINGNCNGGSIIGGWNNIIGNCSYTYVGGMNNNVPSLYQGFVHGSNLIVNGSHNSVTFGKNNIEDTEGSYCFAIGNGESTSERSNAFAITWDGDIVSATGKVLSSNDFTDELKTKLENMEGGSSGDGDSIIWSFGSNNGVTPIVKIGYEVLPSGRLMLHVQIGLDDIGGDSTVFTNGWSGNVSAFSTSGVNSAETNEYHNNVVKPFIKKLYDLIGHSFKISGTIGIEVSDGDNVTTTFMKISIPDESTLELFIKKPEGTLTEGNLYGNITTII